MPVEGICLRVTHTEVHSDSVPLYDIDDGVDALGVFRKAGPIYVPFGQTVELVYTSSVAKSFEIGALRTFIEQGLLTAEFVYGSSWRTGITEVQDEGIVLTSDARTLNFVGAGVTASNVGSFVTVTIPGGAGGGDHATLSNLGWLVSAHTGAANELAGFDGAGATTTYSRTVTGDVSGTFPGPLTVTDFTFAGQAQGDVLYFDGTNWVILPAGTNGQVLQTQGPGADPVWTSTPSSVSHAALTNLGWTVSGHTGTASTLAAFDGGGAAVHISTTVSGDVSGTLPGPLSVSDFTLAGEAQGDVLYFDGINWVVLPAGTSGQVLQTQGPGADPVWAASGAGADHSTLTNLGWAVSAHTGTAGSLAAFDGAGATAEVTGVSHGDILYFNGTTWVRLAPGTAGERLQTNGAGSAPTWVTAGGGVADHTGLSNLLWTASDHTGTASRIAAFDGGGAASYLQIGVDVQAWDTDLDALAALATTGILSRTGAGTFATRTLTGTAGLITVTDGDGVSGNPTINVGANVITTSDSASGDVAGSYPGPLTVTDLTITGEVQGSVLYFDGTNWTQLAPGTAGNVLQTNGAGSDPTWSGVSGGNTIINNLGGTYTTIQDLANLMWSAGHITGGVITDAGGATVNVTAGSGLIRDTASRLADLFFFDWPSAAGLSVPLDTSRYVGVEYNAGSPQVVLRASDTWDYLTDFPLGEVYNEGGILHVHSDPWVMGDDLQRITERFSQTAPFVRDEDQGGLALGESGDGNRFVTVSGGAIWHELLRFPVTAIDTDPGGAADDIDRFYRNGSGGFTLEVVTQWNNTQYDDGTGTLATIPANRYANLLSQYGRFTYSNVNDARQEAPPATGPDRITEASIIIGRIIFRNGETTARRVDSSFTQSFGTSATSAHSDLAGLGWTAALHTGTAGSLAAFDGAGAAAVLTGVSQGDVAYFDGTIWTRLAPGTSGEFLRTQGVGSDPVWATPTGFTWKQPVDVKGYLGTRTVTEINALTPTIGQSVVAGDPGTPTAGTSDLLATGDVAEFDGTSWKKILGAAGGFPPAGTRALVDTDPVTLYSPLTDGTDEGKCVEWDGTSLTPSSLVSPTDGDAVLVRGEGSVNENQAYVFDGAVPSGEWVQFSGGGTVDHTALSNLGWTASGHTGAAGSLATFDGAGASSVLTGVSHGDILYFNGTTWVRLAPGSVDGNPLTTTTAGSAPTWDTTIAVDTVTESTANNGVLVNGIRNYGKSAADPAVGPAPADGDTYYNTSMRMGMVYDGLRSKWLSAESTSFHFGRDGNTAANQYYRAADGRVMSSTSGWYAERSGTVISMAYTRTDTDAATFDIVGDGASLTTVASSAIGGRSIALNADFTFGQVLAVLNQAGGNTTSNVIAHIRVKWRV
jgi:hypothetical protein